LIRDDDPTVFSSGPDGSASHRKHDRGGEAHHAPQKKPADGIVRVRRETSGRKGKTVTTIEGVPGSSATLASLATDLKRMCGSGGTVKAQVIEIQGDHGDRIMALLEARGFTVKRAGG